MQVQEASDCIVCILVQHLVCYCGYHNFRLKFFLFRIFKCYIGWKITCWFRVFTISHCTRVLRMLWNITGHMRNNLNKAFLKFDKNTKNSHKIISMSCEGDMKFSKWSKIRTQILASLAGGKNPHKHLNYLFVFSYKVMLQNYCYMKRWSKRM